MVPSCLVSVSVTFRHLYYRLVLDRSRWLSSHLLGKLPARLTLCSLCIMLKVKRWQRSESEAIRTQLQPLKRNWEITNITNSQKERTYDFLFVSLLFPIMVLMAGFDVLIALIHGPLSSFAFLAF